MHNFGLDLYTDMKQGKCKEKQLLNPSSEVRPYSPALFSSISDNTDRYQCLCLA